MIIDIEVNPTVFLVPRQASTWSMRPPTKEEYSKVIEWARDLLKKEEEE